MYRIFKARASQIIELKTNSNPSDESSLNSPPAPAGPIPHGKEESLSIIQYDLPRTYSNHDASSIATHFGIISKTLASILETYACYRPDVGYIQGMNYIAAMCVHYFDEYQAFCVFANLINRQIHFNLFTLDPDVLKSFSLTFDHFFQRHLPQLYLHLLAESISSEIFLLDWALTLFSKALPLDTAARLWDVYLYEGELFFIKSCLGNPLIYLFDHFSSLGILEMYEFKLETTVDSGILKFLLKLPSDLDIDKLLRYIANISLTHSEYDAIRRQYAPSSIPISYSYYPSSMVTLSNSISVRTAATTSPPRSETDDRAEIGDDLYCFIYGFSMCFPYHQTSSDPVKVTHKA